MALVEYKKKDTSVQSYVRANGTLLLTERLAEICNVGDRDTFFIPYLDDEDEDIVAFLFVKEGYDLYRKGLKKVTKVSGGYSLRIVDLLEDLGLEFERKTKVANLTRKEDDLTYLVINFKDYTVEEKEEDDQIDFVEENN